MASEQTDVLRFEAYELDLSRHELRHAGEVVSVEPQVLDLLAFLAKRPQQVVTRDDLIEGVWNGRIVSDSAISTRISAARQAVGDDGKRQALIKTVSRRGFLFVPVTGVVDLSETDLDLEDEASPSSIQTAERYDRGRPSIVVLPFANQSANPDQSYFSDGIADDIITDLSRYSELFVIARQSAFAFHNRHETTCEFANHLGVQFVLDGSVRRQDKRVRVTAQLIEVGSQTTLWADKFDREIRDIFDVQEEIATVIVNTLVGQISHRHSTRVRLRNTDAVSAYDHMLKAQQHIWNFSPEDIAQSRREAEAAIRLDPDYARAHAVLAWALHTQGTNGWSDDPDRPFDKALEHAKAAVAADENEPWGHCALGFVVWWRDRDFKRGLDEVRIAVRLNPSNAHFRMIVGATLAYMGKGDEALEEMDTAMRLNPLYPGLYLVHKSRAYFVAGRYEEALSQMERAAAAMPAHPNALALLAACYAALGRADNAASIIPDIKRVSPEFTLRHVRRTLPFANSEDLDIFCNLLKGAGLPE